MTVELKLIVMLFVSVSLGESPNYSQLKEFSYALRIGKPDQSIQLHNP